MTDKNPKDKKTLSTVIRSVISVALIGIIVWTLDMDELTSTLASVSILTLVALVVIDVILRLLSAYRWHVLFDALHDSVTLGTVARITFVASFLGQILPGVVGVEALRAIGLAKASNNAPAALASVVADRVFGLLSLVLVIYGGLIIGPSELRSMVLAPTTASLVVLLVIVILMMHPVSRRWFTGAMPAKILEKVRKFSTEIFNCLDRYKTKPGVLAYSVFLAVLFQFMRVVLFYSAALLLGASPSFVFFVALVPIVMFAALLPISIGGLGVREASLVVLFDQFDVMDSSQAFTVAILVFISGILSIIPGGWFYIGQKNLDKEDIYAK